MVFLKMSEVRQLSKMTGRMGSGAVPSTAMRRAIASSKVPEQASKMELPTPLPHTPQFSNNPWRRHRQGAAPFHKRCRIMGLMRIGSLRPNGFEWICWQGVENAVYLGPGLR